MSPNDQSDRAILQRIARRVMLERGLRPDFTSAALAELAGINAPASLKGKSVRDLRGLPWCSIDNDDSLDLDQITVAEGLPGGQARIRVAVADVDALVPAGSALDEQAGHNTVSVYAAGGTFPMLPDKLSTNLTSLNAGVDRLAIVMEMVIGADGSLQDSDVYQAIVHNHAKLAYNSLGAWLEGRAEPPQAVKAVKGLSENLRLQDRVAQSMRMLRHEHGALYLETIEARPVFEGDTIRALVARTTNRATQLIEDFMIAANRVTARYLESKQWPSIRRVVRVPRRWERIVEIAAEYGARLPTHPDSRALNDFLTEQKTTDPLRFPDLSLAVIKLLGSGEYVAQGPEDAPLGHFGLAVKDYTHSTAPNRRYSDIITQRLLKAALTGAPLPYSDDELADLATHCTEAEDVAAKIERQLDKSAAALLLRTRIGERFGGVITGAAEKGTWVRLLQMPVEGKLVQGFRGVDVGQRIDVELLAVDVEQGYIDFARA